MLRLAIAGSLLASLAGCSLYFDHNETPPPDATVCAEPAIPAQPRLLDPQDLVCETFGTGETCGCGVACPPTNGVDIPTWGPCYSSCEGLAEDTCLETPDCHVDRDWQLYYTNQPSFIGCHANDTAPDQTTQIEPCSVRGAEECSQDSTCAGLYQVVLTDCPNCGADGSNSYIFNSCVPATQIAGQCTGDVTCTVMAPTCNGLGTTPGIEGGCYTGACIPEGFCPTLPD